MERLKIVTLNLWAERDHPERRLEWVLAGLTELEPDLVALQEVVEGPKLAQASTLGRALGMRWAFGSVKTDAARGAVGNAILSRYPIERADNLRLPSIEEDPRGALRARVTLPERTVDFTSCHLSFGTDRVRDRERQVLAIDHWLQPTKGEGSPSMALLAGDFNSRPESRAIRFLTGLDSLEGRETFFRDVWARRHPGDPGYSFSARNPKAVRWQEQNRRVDYVFIRGPVRGSGDGSIEEARLLFEEPSPDGVWASDHFGLLAIFRMAG